MPNQQPSLFPLDGLETTSLPDKPLLTPADSLEAALPLFEAYMAQREFAQNTRAAFRNDLKLFAAFVGMQATLGACTQIKLEAFLEHMRTGRPVPISGRSLDRRITTLKVFFGWLVDKGVLRIDPAAPLEHLGSQSPLPQILTEGQIDKVLTLTRQMRDAGDAPDARPHLLILLILDAALKKTECLNLALEHIDVSDPAQPSITVHYERPRQRFKARRLAVSPEWASTLSVYLRRYQPKEKLFECTGRNLEYLLHTIATVAYLPFALTFEMLRWTSAARSLRAGMDPEHLRKRLGLSRIAWQATWPTLQKLIEGPL